MAALSRMQFAHHGPDRASRRVGAAVAIGLHVAAAVALLSYEPARTALLSAAPIMIDFITPPKPPEPRPATPSVEPPKPKQVAKVVQPPKPVVQPSKALAAPPSVLTVPSEAPAAIVAASPSPPGPTTGSAPPAEAAQGAPSGSASITAPIFSADYLENPSPAYPPVSRRMREEGRVLLRVHVTPQGTADEVQVRTTSGISRLDDAAVETVRRWKFVPARRGAEAVAAWVLIPISFKLES